MPSPLGTHHPVSRRRQMARRLGFINFRAFEAWENEIALDHFANFICDYLAHGYAVVPDLSAGFVEFVDLDQAVAERIQMLEERRFETVLDPDKGEWAAKDHYKQFIVGVVADDAWLGQYGVDGAEIFKRGWTARETTVKMFEFLEFFVQEWVDGRRDESHREKANMELAKLGQPKETDARVVVRIIEEMFEGGSADHSVAAGQASSSVHNPAKH
ncbi:hypothetical protein VTI74DRAFT_11494 [Chaetomium olivicolor]